MHYVIHANTSWSFYTRRHYSSVSVVSRKCTSEKGKFNHDCSHIHDTTCTGKEAMLNKILSPSLHPLSPFNSLSVLRTGLFYFYRSPAICICILRIFIGKRNLWNKTTLTQLANSNNMLLGLEWAWAKGVIFPNFLIMDKFPIFVWWCFQSVVYI
jgi:hypothetical protein